MAKSLKGKTKKFKVVVTETVTRWAEVEVEVPLREPSYATAEPYENDRLYDEIQEEVWNANLDWDENCEHSNLDIEPVTS